MDLLLALLASFLLLIVSVLNGYFVAYPLLLAMMLFVVVLIRRGFDLRSLLKMAYIGSQKSFAVIKILLLIGAVTATWMASGTVPAIVYYGIQLISPQYFILAAFLLTSFVSLLIGTSFGTVGTIGISLMIMASGSGVDPHLIAGAIMAGAYFGDRCSPMSSSAHLIATVTNTNLYANIKNMWKTTGFSLFMTIAIYTIFSLLNPVQITDQSFTLEIQRIFDINPIVLLPAIAILILAILKVDVKISMLSSLAMAVAIALWLQHYSILELFKFIVVGFSLQESTPLTQILLGGGILAMAKVCLVVIISTAFVGIFAGTRALDNIEAFLERAQSRGDLFLSTCLVGLGSAAFGCTQAIAILLTQQLVEKKYKENEKGNYKLALDLENTVVVIAPLVPWNIAGLVPATLLMTDAGFIPYAVYLYLLPLLNLISIRLSTPPKLRLCN